MSDVIAEIDCLNDLIEGLIALKNKRNLSNEALEELCLLTRGHVDKVFGPSREKNPGWKFLEWVLKAMAGKLLLVEDTAQAEAMKPRWEGRNKSQIRVRPFLIDKKAIEIAKPEVFAAMARRRALVLPASIRSKIASDAAKARWSKRRSKRNGSSATRTVSRSPGASRAD